MHRLSAVLMAFFCLTGAFASLSNAAERIFDVCDYGAVGDGKALNTEAIQKTVDACAAGGGGTVYFPPGTFRSGSIHLKSRVALYLEAGCTLLGSENLADYPETKASIRSFTDTYVNRCLIAGDGLENIAIRGRGVIDGNGEAYYKAKLGYLNRPYVIRLVGCRGVLVEDVTLRNSPMWMQHYLACDRVTIRGITVFNHIGWNNDALDIDGCHDVAVSDSKFDSDDDAITLKSTLDRACENVTITNCLASSHCSAIKMGTESNGGFKGIVISNCTVCSPRYTKAIGGRQRGMDGIDLEIVDGGCMDRVTISNITIDGVTIPIFVRLGNRARPFSNEAPKPNVGTLRNVILSNIVATNVSPFGCAITGIPNHPIENLTLSNIRLEFDGGGKLATKPVEEMEDAYPYGEMFGPLPAFGLYCRHVKNLRLDNVQLISNKPDARPPMLFEDVQDCKVDGVDAR